MFEQEIRWSSGALLVLGVGFLLVISLVVGPVLLSPLRGRALGIMLGATATLVVVSVVIGFNFITLRVSVDERALTVGFGPFRDHILLERIVACEPTSYRWTRWGGFGIRFRTGAKLYNVPGDGGTAAQVTLDDGRRILFSSRDPDAVCRTLRERRSEIRGEV